MSKDKEIRRLKKIIDSMRGEYIWSTEYHHFVNCVEYILYSLVFACSLKKLLK